MQHPTVYIITSKQNQKQKACSRRIIKGRNVPLKIKVLIYFMQADIYAGKKLGFLLNL
jgi:hypothetical protein